MLLGDGNIVDYLIVSRISVRMRVTGFYPVSKLRTMGEVKDGAGGQGHNYTPRWVPVTSLGN